MGQDDDAVSLSLFDLKQFAAQFRITLPDSREEAERIVRELHQQLIRKRQILQAAVAAALSTAAGTIARYPRMTKRDWDPAGYYSVLNLPKTATDQQVKEAYHRQSLLLHEDRHASQPKEIQEIAKKMQQQVNQAKEVLCDPRLRASYDHQGAEGVKRAELVPHNLAGQELLRTLDMIERRDEFLQTAKEVSSSGNCTISFDVRPYLAPLAEQVVHHIPYLADSEEEEWEEEEEEEEEGDEEEGEMRQEDQESDDDDSVLADPPQVGDVEGEGEEGGSAAPAGASDGNPLVQQRGVGFKLHEIMVDGKKVYALIPPENMQQKLRAVAQGRMAQQVGVQTQEDEEERPGFLAALKRLPLALPPPTAIRSMHGFTFPTSAKGSFLFQGGTPSWMKVSYHYAINAMKTLKARVMYKLDMMTLSFGWVQAVSEAVKATMRLHIYSQVAQAMWFTSLSILLSKNYTSGRYMWGKLSVSPVAMHNMLTWGVFDAKKDSGTAMHSLRIGPDVLQHMYVSRIELLRKESDVGNEPPPDDIFTTEGEVEASRSRGHMVATMESNFLNVQTRLTWKVLLNLSKKTNGFKVGFGVETTLPTSLGLLKVGGMRSHTEFVLTFQRYQHSIHIPLLISTSSNLVAATTVFITPFILYKVLQKAVVNPWSRIMRRRNLVKRRLAKKAKLASDLRNALLAQQLLRTVAQRRMEEEADAPGGGLIIQNAKYGCLHPSVEYDGSEDPANELPPRTLDVTTALQAKVEKHHLILYAGPKHHLDGFYDVDPDGDDEKYIRIRYSFLGANHEVEVAEDMEVAIPMQEHRID